MKVTELQMYRCTGKGRLKAICNIVLDGGVAMNEIRLEENAAGRLCCHYPASYSSIPGKLKYYCCPINHETQQMIEKAILEEYFYGRDKGCT